VNETQKLKSLLPPVELLVVENCDVIIIIIMNTLPRVPAVHANVAIKSGCVGGGLGVVATGPIKTGELIERCILTRLLESYPGHDDPHVFVWWKGPPGTTYAHSGTGQSTAEEGKWEPPKLQSDPKADTFGEVAFTEEDMAKGNICWCQGSGNAIFYNTGPKEVWNTRSVKDFENDVLELIATKDIAAGEEVIIMYSSVNWRDCWDELRTALE
jgi:hypothetical protein